MSAAKVATRADTTNGAFGDTGLQNPLHQLVRPLAYYLDDEARHTGYLVTPGYQALRALATANGVILRPLKPLANPEHRAYVLVADGIGAALGLAATSYVSRVVHDAVAMRAILRVRNRFLCGIISSADDGSVTRQLWRAGTDVFTALPMDLVSFVTKCSTLPDLVTHDEFRAILTVREAAKASEYLHALTKGDSEPVKREAIALLNRVTEQTTHSPTPHRRRKSSQRSDNSLPVR